MCRLVYRMPVILAAVYILAPELGSVGNVFSECPMILLPVHVLHRDGGMDNRMPWSSYVSSNGTRNIACRLRLSGQCSLRALVAPSRISCKACLDNLLPVLCARVVRIVGCKTCIPARNVRRCCSECRYDSGTPFSFGGVLHLCMPCSISTIEGAILISGYVSFGATVVANHHGVPVDARYRTPG